MTISDEAHNELLFRSELPRLRLEADIWPCTEGVSIKVAADAIDFGWDVTRWDVHPSLLTNTSPSGRPSNRLLIVRY